MQSLTGRPERARTRTTFPAPGRAVTPVSPARACGRRVGVAVVLLLALPAAAAPPAITPPRLVTFVRATLPADAPWRSADVVVWISIGTDGSVTEVELKTGAGEPWDSAALAATRAFRFDPARLRGRPLAVRVPFTYRFRAPSRRGPMVPSVRGRRPLHPAPGYRLRGLVLENGTRTPLAGIPVQLTHPRSRRTFEVVTDDQGRYRFEGLPHGRLRLRIETGEHAVIKRVVRGTPVSQPEKPVYLDPVGLPKYRLVIKAKPRPKAATEIFLSEDEIRKTPGTFGDPTRVVATLPGVSRTPFGLGYYAVRGANFENTGFFIDGHPALFLYHLFGGPGVIHPELVGSVTFFPGGYPVSYGRFAGGAIMVETKSPPKDRWHLDVEVDLLKASLLYSRPFLNGKGEVTVAVRRSYYELLIPLVTDQDIEISYTDYLLRVTYEFTRSLRLRFVALGAEDSFASVSGGPKDGGGEETKTKLSLGFHRLVLALDADFTSKLRLETSVAWEYDRNDSARTATDDDPIDVGIAGWFLNMRSKLVWTPLKNVRVETGFDGLVAQVDAKLQIPTLAALGDPRPPVFDPITVDRSLSDIPVSFAPFFASVDWEVVDGLRLIPGFRLGVEYYAGETHVTYDPKLSIRYRVHPAWTLKAQGGLAHQAPPFFETVKPIGDPSIPPVRAVQSSLGVEWSPGDGWDISAEGFFTYLQNLARPSSAVTTENGKLSRLLWTADVEGRAYGAEFMIRKRVGGRHYGWISYTISRTERRNPGQPWKTHTIDQTHILNIAWSVRLGADWSIGARFSLSSGNPAYRVIGSRYDADRDRYEPIYGAGRVRRPVFHRLDIRVDKRWRFDTWFLEAYLDIQNVYNASNPESPRYSFDYSKETDGASIPILPTIGLRAAF